MNEPITLVKVIERCEQCRHLSHSGAFTIGGAKPVCDGPDVIDLCAQYQRRPKPEKLTRLINNDKLPGHCEACDYISWRHKVVKPDHSPPAWCPLRNGRAY